LFFTSASEHSTISHAYRSARFSVKHHKVPKRRKIVRLLFAFNAMQLFAHAKPRRALHRDEHAVTKDILAVTKLVGTDFALARL